MYREIERKFLLQNDQWKESIQTTQHLQQGYLILPNKESGNQDNKSSVRIRIADQSGYLTIKSLEIGISRDEFEYSIPYEEAQYMLDNLCIHSLIQKKRHLLNYENHQWSIDEFQGTHRELMIAEIELENENETFARPPWLGEEVTHCVQYYNTSLIKQS